MPWPIVKTPFIPEIELLWTIQLATHMAEVKKSCSQSYFEPF